MQKSNPNIQSNIQRCFAIQNIALLLLLDM